MDAMTIKMDAQYKELQSQAKQPTTDLNNDDMPMSREEESKFMKTFRKTRFYNDYRDRDSNRDNWRSNGRNDYHRDNYQSKTDDKPYNLQKQFNDFIKSQQSTNAFFDRLADSQSGRPSGSLPSNTQLNPQGSKANQPSQARTEHVNAVFTRSGKSYDPPDNPNDQQDNSENPINFDSDDEDDEPTLQPKTQPTKPVKETPLPKSQRKQNPPFYRRNPSRKRNLFRIRWFMAIIAGEISKSESDTEEPPFEKIAINTDYKIKTSLEEPPADLELKPLPGNLEYVFLKEPFFPLIISSKLSTQNKSKLVFVRKKHKEAFAWKTTDIPGICLSFCKHKIQLLNDKKPVVQKQRRLNPNMQEFVKKEIVKLLDTGIIYPIADSPWVNPIHCVPKKGGITVVTN
nr:reverse transcriptase domain-containing protein [Tanacetum cinerariifolium]